MMRTHLAQNQFITNPAMPTTGSAVAFSDPSGSAATAAPILAATRDARALALSSQAALANGFAPKEMLMTLSPPEAIPTSTGGPKRAPAGIAPNTAAPAGLWHNPWTQAVEIRAASQGAFAGGNVTSDEHDIAGHAANQCSEPGEAGVSGSIPERSTNHTDLEQLIGVAGKRRRRPLALPRFVPDEDAIERAMHDPNAPRLRAGDPVWADESPLFLQRSA